MLTPWLESIGEASRFSEADLGWSCLVEVSSAIALLDMHCSRRG